MSACPVCPHGRLHRRRQQERCDRCAYRRPAHRPPRPTPSTLDEHTQQDHRRARKMLRRVSSTGSMIGPDWMADTRCSRLAVGYILVGLARAIRASMGGEP